MVSLFFISNSKSILFLQFFLIQLLFAPFSFSQQSGALYPQTLTCENLQNPVGIDSRTPRLSWNSISEKRNVTQSGYRILAASSEEKLKQNQGDLWDTGKVISQESLYIPYLGKSLKTGENIFWKVRLWNAKGEVSFWSKPSSWTMGLLEASDWQGDWIGLDDEMGEDKLDTTFTRLSARYLRKEVKLRKKIKNAKAHVAGFGLFELYLNGRKISNAVLAPALAEYPERGYYMSFDITDQFKRGHNAIGIILGNGRFVGMRFKEIELYYDESKLTHFGFPKMLAQFEINYEDGTSETIVSDTSWKITADGPIRANSEFDGEEYDANKEMTGWNRVNFDDSNWLQAEVVEAGVEILSAQMTPPIEVIEEILPKAISKVNVDTFIVDMGQNMVGWVKLKVKGDKGNRVSLRFAERLDTYGNLYLDPIRTAKVNDIYILKGGEEEEWEPKFTYHGFRYVEITGFPGELTLENIIGRVVHDALEPIGEFTTSNKTINQIYQNARWGIKGNYRSIPTDCPQRDERQAWLGDRATGSRGESYLFDNASFYTKWLQDIEDSQLESGSIPDVAPTYWKIYSDNITWPAAYIIIADMLHDQFGEDKGIRQHYDSMKKWMHYMKENYMTDYIISKDTYGDWGVPPEEPGLIHSQDARKKTSPAVLSTSYYYHLLGLMREFALRLDKTEDALFYGELRAKIKLAFHEEFFDSIVGAYKNNTATTNVLAIHFGLVPKEYQDDVFNNLVKVTTEDFNNHISVGLIGVQAIMRIFTDQSRPDIAFKLATNTDYPSWGYMLEQGATTIWELWNSDTADPFMNSWNHVMLLGDLIIWFYEDLAGIKPNPKVPGFKNFIMKPTPVGDLIYVKAAHNSPYGMIRSEWEIKTKEFHWNITVPPNTTATVHIPAGKGDTVFEGLIPAEEVNGIQFIGIRESRKVYEVGSGNYSFRVAFDQ